MWVSLGHSCMFRGLSPLPENCVLLKLMFHRGDPSPQPSAAITVVGSGCGVSRERELLRASLVAGALPLFLRGNGTCGFALAEVFLAK